MSEHDVTQPHDSTENSAAQTHETLPTDATPNTAGPPSTTGTPVADETQQRLRTATGVMDNADRAMPPVMHDTFLDERNDVMSVINELEDQLDRHQEVRETLERDLADANERLQTANQRIQELEWQIVTFQTRVEALEQVRQEVTLLEEEITNTNGRIQRLTEERQGVEKERNRLRNELKAANKQLEDLWAVRKERDGLKTDVKDLTAKIEEQDRTLREVTDDRNQQQTRLQETLAALDETRSERHQQQILLRAAEDRTRELGRVQDELLDKLETSRQQKKALQAQMTHLERENARLVEQRQYYETELSSMRGMNRNAEVALASVKKAFAEVRVALTETKSRARRRMIETWPRIGIPNRGFEDLPLASDADMDETDDFEPATAEHAPDGNGHS